MFGVRVSFVVRYMTAASFSWTVYSLSVSIIGDFCCLVAVSAMDVVELKDILRVSAATKMDNRRDGENVIHIIGGDEADNRNDKPVASTWYGCGEGSGGDRTVPSESSQIPTFGSSSLEVVENDRSYKPKHCKNYYTEAGCPFGDNCIYIHDEEAKTRESFAIFVGPSFSGGYRDGAATGIGGGPAPPPPLAPLPARTLAAATGIGGGPAAPPPLAPLPARTLAVAVAAATPPLARIPLAHTLSSGTVRPLNWRSRICNRWEQSGYCQFGSECFFAHGEAELQRCGGGPGDREANPNNQRVMVPNLAAASGSSAAHAVTASAADAGGSGQMSGATQRPIPRWKVPKKIVGIYGDWIDDLE
ncbi:hypothetical protein L1987_56089 [Smallanthus sonchifolius]|uniref:Uncharacterized protein n=1 Tax=Smallanthus sonchifolius TaxID=185202 RepID=A0ACB9EBP2_9ASTR|nr:hypothetical protein L1987_56089 [Smallanthus sonchifolius]